MNEWYYDVDYASNTTMYDHTVEEYPQMLYSADTKDIHHYGNTPYYNLNQNASEYYKGHETNWLFMLLTIGISLINGMCIMAHALSTSVWQEEPGGI